MNSMYLSSRDMCRLRELEQHLGNGVRFGSEQNRTHKLARVPQREKRYNKKNLPNWAE